MNPLGPSTRPQASHAALSRSVESYRVVQGWVTRAIEMEDGHRTESLLCEAKGLSDGPLDPDAAEAGFLRNKAAMTDSSFSGASLRCVDLFSGCGGLSVGAREAARGLGRGFHPALAVDFNDDATKVYAKNFPGGIVESSDLAGMFDSAVGERLSRSETRIADQVGPVDLLLGGPPCQGHSDLNNRTRRLDPKNGLYFVMARAAEVLRPTHLLIENVPGALNDRGRVVQRTADALSDIGYQVDFEVVDVSRIGVPQRRKRLVMLASLARRPDAAAIEARFSTSVRSASWAISDLVGIEDSSSFDTPANSAPATRDRIRYLFEHDLFELPNSERPPCHRDKEHSYSSIYGRIRWDKPSQTITTGFYSMCMGRYVHPSEQRTLTAHEAARLQYFPDSFDFSSVSKRSSLAQMIGNAVPSRLSYAAVLELLRS